MLSVEDWAEIRRLHFSKEWGSRRSQKTRHCAQHSARRRPQHRSTGLSPQPASLRPKSAKSRCGVNRSSLDCDLGGVAHSWSIEPVCSQSVWASR